MGRATYVCATCAEHFTRRYSATRHNLTIHGNRGEIVPLLEYLVGRSTGPYRANHPFWYRRRRGRGIHNFGHATTVADSIGDTFQVGVLPQHGQYEHQQQSLEERERYRWQQQQALSQSIPTPTPPAIQHASSYPTDQMFQSQSQDTTDDEETTITLSHESKLKIEELKRLVYKYPQYHINPDAVIKWAIYCCNDGDNTFLDEKLEQLRMFDSAMGYTRM
jgi:hypothetical protein